MFICISRSAWRLEALQWIFLHHFPQILYNCGLTTAFCTSVRRNASQRSKFFPFVRLVVEAKKVRRNNLFSEEDQKMTRTTQQRDEINFSATQDDANAKPVEYKTEMQVLVHVAGGPWGCWADQVHCRRWNETCHSQVTYAVQSCVLHFRFCSSAWPEWSNTHQH